MTPSVKSSNMKDRCVTTTRSYFTLLRNDFQTLCWPASKGGQFNGAACRSIRPHCRHLHSVWARPNINPHETIRFSLRQMIDPPLAYVVVAYPQAVDFKTHLPAFGNLHFDFQSGSHDYLIGRR